MTAAWRRTGEYRLATWRRRLPRAAASVLLHLGRALRNYQRDHDGLRAAAIAYWGLLSFFPFVLLVGAAAAHLGRGADSADVLLGSLRIYVPFVRDDFWREVGALAKGAGAVLPAASLLVLFVLASQVSVATDRAMRIIFHADRHAARTLLQQVRARLRAYVMSFVGVLVIGTTFVARSALAYLTVSRVRGVDVLASALVRPVVWGHVVPSLSVGFMAYTLFRRVQCTPRIQRSAAILGAVVFVIGQELAMALYTWIIASEGDKASLYYGAFVGLMLLVIWTYWLASCLLLAAEMVAEANGNRALAERRFLAVTERLSLQGGADRYLHEVVRATAGDGHDTAWSVLHGYADATAGPLAAAVEAERFRPLEWRVPHRRDADAARQVRTAIARAPSDAILVQNVLSPALLAALADEPRSVLVVQDHRVFCPARGKVLADGQPCAEPLGSPCDRCFAHDAALDTALRDQRLALTLARLEVVRRFERVIVLSRYMAGELAAAGVAPERVQVIPPPIPEWAERAGARRPAPVGRRRGIVVPGRIAWHKGSVHVVEALAAAGIACHVTFAGAGPGERDVWAAAERLGIGARVTVTGWLADDALAAVLRAARVVVVPSLWAEPFGLVGIEAAALGLPVVAHAVGAVPEWLDDRTGLLAPPADAPALAAAVRRVLEDDALADDLGATARELALRRHGRPSFAAAWRGVLAEAAGGPFAASWRA